MRGRQRIVAVLVLFAALLVALLVALLAASGWRLRDLVAQDACLDAGGAWRDSACRH